MSTRKQIIKVTAVKALKGMPLFLIAALLSGCAGMNTDFGCNEVQGVSSCTSMWNVNKMANEGDFNNATRVLTNSKGQMVITPASGAGVVANPSIAAGAGPSTKNAPTQAVGYMGPTPQPGAPIRYGETTEQIWIAPWVDTAGNYHEPAYIYTVVSSGHWIGDPAQAVRENN